jgi:hypothetical protein
MGVLAGVFYYVGRGVQQETERDIRRRLIMEMRIIATEPIPDPNDPSFKNWENTHRIQYRAGPTPAHGRWPGFVDPAERPRAHGRSGPEVSASSAIMLQDTLELLRALREQKLDYVIVGELAMSAYLADRFTKDADLLMSPNAFTNLPELQIQERTDFFCCGRFRGIQVVAYSTANPFFEAVRLQFATTAHVGGMEVSAATVEGLIALNLYAIHLLTRQRDFYRNERYEMNIITLLALYETSFEPILSLVSSHVPPDNVKELEDTLEACGKYAARARKREQVKVQIS